MDAVQERKERLKALKEAAALVEKRDEKEDAKKMDIPELKFRNYALKDQNIEHIKVAPAKAQELKELVPSHGEETKEPNGEEVVIDVAPKKANWDLKRDVTKKLQKLERRTQRALLEIMQEAEKEKFVNDGGIADEGADVADHRSA